MFLFSSLVAFTTEDRAVWDERFELGGYRVDVELYRHRIDLLASGKHLLVDFDYYSADASVKPYLKIINKTAFLSFSASPATGSGIAACIWKITERGTKLEKLGEFRDADLRRWFADGVIFEERPMKYATADMVKTIPRLFQDRKLAFSKFILSYKFEGRKNTFQFVGYRQLKKGEQWPEIVRFPK